MFGGMSQMPPVSPMSPMQIIPAFPTVELKQIGNAMYWCFGFDYSRGWNGTQWVNFGMIDIIGFGGGTPPLPPTGPAQTGPTMHGGATPPPPPGGANQMPFPMGIPGSIK